MARRTLQELMVGAKEWFSDALASKKISVVDLGAAKPLRLEVLLRARGFGKDKIPVPGFIIDIHRNYSKASIMTGGCDGNDGSSIDLPATEQACKTMYGAIRGFQKNYYPGLTFQTGLLWEEEQRVGLDMHLRSLLASGFGLSGEYSTGLLKEGFPGTDELKQRITEEMRNSGIDGKLMIKRHSPVWAYNRGIKDMAFYSDGVHVRVCRKKEPDLSFTVAGARSGGDMSISITDVRIQPAQTDRWLKAADEFLESLTYLAKGLPARHVIDLPVLCCERYQNILITNEYRVRGVSRLSTHR